MKKETKKIHPNQIKTHVDKASRLLNEDSIDSLRYACLELRFALELISYSRVEAYLNQLPFEVIKIWQPGKLIKTLAQIDPHVESSGTIKIFNLNDDGSKGSVSFEGTFESAPSRWISKWHHKLGSFLHAPTINKLSSSPTPHQTLHDSLKELISSIHKIIKAPVQNPVFLNGVQLKCLNGCGTTTTCNTETIPANKQIECVNPDCRAVHLIEELPENKFRWRLRTIEWSCRTCGSSNTEDFHSPTYPEVWICSSCNTEWLFDFALNISNREEWEQLQQSGIIPKKLYK